jgi:hypothetical protein
LCFNHLEYWKCKKQTSLPFLGLNDNLWSISTAGMRKAKVFPLPVLAAPRISLPVIAAGMDLA